jgi:hypothetical protein
MSKNMVLRIREPKEKEGKKKWHYKQLHNSYLVRKLFAQNIVYTGDMRNTYKILVEKREAEMPLHRPRNKWVSNIKR